MNPSVSCENDSAVLALTSPLSLPLPPKKKIHNHPKRLLIKTSPHQCDAPGIDPMSSPHLRINCTDPTEDSCPGRITVRVLTPSRTFRFQTLLPLYGHSDRGVSPNQRTGDTCPHNEPELSSHPSRSGGQPAHLSPLPHPGSKRSTRRQNPQKPFIFFF